MKVQLDIYGFQEMQSGRRPSDLPVVFAGVRALVVETGKRTYIPLIWSEHPGDGNVSKFLDSQPSNSTWCFPTVINNQFLLQLKRHGFTETQEYSDENEIIDVLVRTR